MISVTSAASAVRDLPSESSVVRDDSAFLPDLPLPSLTLIVYASPLTTAASAVRDISSESSILLYSATILHRPKHVTIHPLW